MTLSFFIGLLTALVSIVFTALVFKRYFERGGAHLLMWGLGLALYAIGGATETLLAFGWNAIAFRLWYWSGALMVAAVLAQGTLHLLVRKPYIATITSVTMGVIALASLVWMFSVPLNEAAFTPGDDIGTFLTESYRAILPQSVIRRVLPPVLNGYGTLVLAGGAIYSAWLFARKQILPHRVLGNVLIAIGGILPALGGAIIKLAETSPELSESGAVLKYIGIFLGVLILFAGFQVATSGSAQKAAPNVRTARQAT
jgi:hypothetical protein